MIDPDSPPLASEADLLVPGLIHEMRHPLTGLKAGLQLIARTLGQRATSLDEWDLVTSQVRRLEEVLQAFQDLVEPERAAAIEFEVEPVVREALALLRFRSRRLGARFSVAVEHGLPAARGSPRALLHAVTNLAVNAFDAVDEAGRPGRVEVRLLRDPLRACPQVRVADEGIGLTPEVALRLFEPRYTTKPPGKGTGLGLPIARRLMEASGGGVRLVEAGDPARRPWAAVELAIDLAPAGERP